MIINGGICKVPGKNITTRTTAATIENREKVECEIAKLWKNVNRTKGLYEVFCETNNLSKELRKTREIMSELKEKYNAKSEKEQAEFLKIASSATGAWMKSHNFVDDIEILSDLVKDNKVVANDRVKLMTMRKAKGLQADVVIMIGLEDDIIPNPKADEEEEARLFYVSMTRAKKLLFMTHAYKRPRNISYGQEMGDKPRSRFLNAVKIKSRYCNLKL